MKLLLIKDVAPSISKLKEKYHYMTGPMPPELQQDIDSTIEVSGVLISLNI